jgi:hypothetical protein
MPVYNPVNLGKLAAETAELTAKLEQRAERAERIQTRSLWIGVAILAGTAALFLLALFN